MTVMLQDVAMILGVRVDEPPIIGLIVIGEGKRWDTWPDCCDDLLGRHPLPDVMYHDPFSPHIRSTCRMGQYMCLDEDVDRMIVISQHMC